MPQSKIQRKLDFSHLSANQPDSVLFSGKKKILTWPCVCSLGYVVIGHDTDTVVTNPFNLAQSAAEMVLTWYAFQHVLLQTFRR